MAQTNYTPISLYYSTTASNVPTAANLVPGELAINTADGKLYYEDSSGVVQVLATKSTGSIGGSNTQVQFNNSGSLGGSSSFTWDGTTVTATKFAGALNGTVGATTASTGAFTTLSTSSTTTLSGLTASTALALDASKNVVSVTNTGTGNNVLSASPTLTGTIAGASLSLSSLTSGRVTYAGASGLLSDSAGFTFDGTYVNIGTGLASLNGLKFLANAGGLAASLNVNHSSGEIQNYGNTNYFQTWYTNNTEKMRITTAGNVGIGTSSPSTKLTVYDTSSPQVTFDNGTSTFIIGNSAGGGNNHILYGTGAYPMIFYTNATEGMRLDTSGNLGLGVTPACILDISGASGGQIKFPATQNASSNANTLDDYEEGTWTPTITFGAASTGITYSLNEGCYTKIGNQVFLTGVIQLSSKGSATGYADIRGLPFTVQNTNGAISAASMRFVNISFSGAFQGVAPINSTLISLTQISILGSVTDLTDTNFSNNSSITFSINYRV